MILDCTLRDGGYYNNWSFSSSLVNKYLTAIESAKIDIVEIGFRLLSAKQSLGPFAYSTDDFLKKLPLPRDLQIAVMINAQDYIESNLGVIAALETAFMPKAESPIDIVRIATHVDNIDNCKVIARHLHKLGYHVFINLMQVDKVESSILRKIVNKVESWGIIEVFYFADSFGGMNATSIGTVVDSIKSEWNGEIGIHAHDNKGHALINTLSALDLGVSYLDATILGMGRGAGNTRIENLLVELKDRGMEDYNPDALFSLSLKEFSSLQEKYKWGSNIYYYLSAAHGIHPTYIQEMLGDGRYDTDQILSAINLLKARVSSSYSIENLLEAIADSIGSERGSWSAKDWAKGKDVLIIGSGPSTKTHISEIKKYIVKNDPIVLCLNINQNVPESLVTAFVACHEARIVIECDLYSKLTKPIILPMARLPIETKELFSNINILDYGLKIQDSNASATYRGCILDNPLVLMYALSLLSVSGVNNILLTGIDGYEDDNPKQQEMIMALSQYLTAHNNLKLYAITPTSYPIQKQLIV